MYRFSYANIVKAERRTKKFICFCHKKEILNHKKKNTKPYRLRALPCVEVGVSVICEQVPNGRGTNSNCTACQPILWKKLSLQLRKNRFAMEKPSGHLKEHRATRWMERMKRIISFLLREHATVFYRVIFLFWHKTDLHGWRTDGRACSHNLKSVHGNE